MHVLQSLADEELVVDHVTEFGRESIMHDTGKLKAPAVSLARICPERYMSTYTCGDNRCDIVVCGCDEGACRRRTEKLEADSVRQEVLRASAGLQPPGPAVCNAANNVSTPCGKRRLPLVVNRCRDEVSQV